MIITTGNVIAIRCPDCGTLEFHLLNLFAFGRQKKQVKIDCSCGAQLAVIGTKDFQTFWFQVNCLMCEAVHLINLSRKRVLAKKVEIVACEDTGVEVGYIGPKETVKRYIQQQDKSLREMADEIGFGEYFDSPEIMYQVLDYLYDIADSDKLYCECGNFQVDIDAFPERLELKCSHCDCNVVVYAESEQDIRFIREAQEIKLTKNGFDFKKPGKINKRKIKNNKK
jgi:hypothetical protein